MLRLQLSMTIEEDCHLLKHDFSFGGERVGFGSDQFQYLCYVFPVGDGGGEFFEVFHFGDRDALQSKGGDQAALEVDRQIELASGHFHRYP